MPRRLSLVFALITVFMLGLIGRAVFLQILPNERLEHRKQKQFQTAIMLEPRRGLILDRNQKELASSVSAYSVFADPALIKRSKKTYQTIAKALSVSPSYVKNKLKNKKRRFVWLKRKQTKEVKRKVEKLNVKGVVVIEESKRIYPNLHILSQTLGFVGSQGKGLEGLELFLDEDLSGNNQKIELKKDARGTPLIVNGQLITEKNDGKNVQLTVDLELQYMVEQELKNAIRYYDAESAVGVVLDVNSSEILSLASYPTYDSNRFLKSSAYLRRNRVLTDAFEPGSTMKTFSIAGALRENIYHRKSEIFCEEGKMQVGNRWIREADVNHKFGWLRLEEILAKSSNVGTTKVSFSLGEKALYKTLRDFGFGERVSGLPGESKGILNELPWKKHTLGAISFGHGIAATPLQIANAYAAIANGGRLHKPYIVKSILDSKGNPLKSYEKQELRRVLSTSDAKDLQEMLVLATSDKGTGKKARIKGYAVGGKTGTAQKVNPDGRGYVKGQYISSFAGFVPAKKPKYVIYIAVDSPKKSYYGSDVAAPLFSRIASFAMLRAGSPAHWVTEEKMQKKTDISGHLWQQTSAIQMMKRDMGASHMPNLKGLSLRESIDLLRKHNVRLQIKGSGNVSKTLPEAGKILQPNDKVLLYFTKDL